MKLVRDKIHINELKRMAEENLLLGQGAKQANLWGINIYPDMVGDEHWIEFDSMINVRPGVGNRTRGVDDPTLQKKIRGIVNKLVQHGDA